MIKITSINENDKKGVSDERFETKKELFLKLGVEMKRFDQD